MRSRDGQRVFRSGDGPAALHDRQSCQQPAVGRSEGRNAASSSSSCRAMRPGADEQSMRVTSPRTRTPIFPRRVHAHCDGTTFLRGCTMGRIARHQEGWLGLRRAKRCSRGHGRRARFRKNGDGMTVRDRSGGSDQDWRRDAPPPFPTASPLETVDQPPPCSGWLRRSYGRRASPVAEPTSVRRTDPRSGTSIAPTCGGTHLSAPH